MIGRGAIARLALLAVLCLALLLPGIDAVPPVDRDESRFAQAARQMLESGDFIDIRFRDEPRHNKPVGIYWLQSAAAAIFGADRIGAYRLPSVLGTVLAVLATYLLGAAAFSRGVGAAAALILCAALAIAVEARQARADAALLGCIALAQLALARIHLDARGAVAAGRVPWWAVLWGATACGVLIKGPVALLVPAATIATLALLERGRDRAWVWRIRPLPGLMLLAAIVAPWLIAISIQSDGAFWAASLGRDFGGKIVAGQESHGAPPGYHTLLLAATFWPGALAVGPALLALWPRRREPAVALLFAWILPVWAIFEAVPTKLPHYVMPAFPALALLVAAGVAGSDMVAPGRWARALAAVLRALAAVAAVGIPGAMLGLALWLAPGVAAIGALAAACAAAAGWLVFQAQRRRSLPQLGAGALAAALASGLTIAIVLPRAEALWVSRDLARHVGEVPAARIVLVGYSEPSAVFLIGREVGFAHAVGAAEALAAGTATLAAVSTRDIDRFERRAGELGLDLRRGAAISGFQYPRGRAITLVLFRSAAAPASQHSG